jgi:tetratricopeptide (TPR) repeat protein
MKNGRFRSVTILFIALASIFACQKSTPDTIQFIRKVNSLDKIKLQLAETDKVGLLYFTTATCGPCKMLQRDVFTNDSVRVYVDAHFVPFWVDADSIAARDLNRHFGINTVPTMVLVDDEGTVIDKVLGYSLERLQKSYSGEGTILSLREAYEADPENNSLALEYAVELSNKYDFKSARPIYEQLIDKFEDPFSKATVYFNLATCYQRTGNIEKAVEIYEKGMKQDLFTEKKDVVLCYLGRHHFQQEKYKSAINYLEMIADDISHVEDLRERHETERSRIFVALAYYELGNDQKGKTILDGLSQSLFDAGNWFQVAEYGQMCRDSDTAIRDILPWTEKAVESSDWNNSYALGAYGLALAKNQRYEEAIKVYNKQLEAYETEPAGPDGATMKEVMPQKYAMNVLWAKAYLAVSHLAAGDTDEGESLVEDMMEAAASPFDAYSSLTYACNDLHPKADNALHWAARAIELDQRENPRLLNVYAELLFANGQVQQAVEVSTRVCELVDHYRYRQNLKRFEAAL